MPYKDPERQRQFNREWRNKRRQDWLAANGPCVRCGSTEKLEVDHIDRGSKVSHKIWSWSKERRETELAKCQVLCFSCHVAKDRPANHGRTLYSKGCKCSTCLEAHRLDVAKWRATKR